MSKIKYWVILHTFAAAHISQGPELLCKSMSISTSSEHAELLPSLLGDDPRPKRRCDGGDRVDIGLRSGLPDLGLTDCGLLLRFRKLPNLGIDRDLRAARGLVGFCFFLISGLVGMRCVVIVLDLVWSVGLSGAGRSRG